MSLTPGDLAPARQSDAETGGGQLQQYLAGCLQGRNLGRAEFLKLSQQPGVGRRTLLAGSAQGDRVRPHLLARLAQEALSAEAVEGPEQPVKQGARPGDPGELVIFGSAAGRQHVVDRPVIGLPSGQQGRVIELPSVITASSACGRS